MALGRGRARRPMLQRRRLTRTTHLPEIERRTGRWRVGPQCLNERRRCITPRRVPPLELPPHMGSATTAPARSTNYVVNHMCEHICEPIHSTGRILPGEPSITMCGENMRKHRLRKIKKRTLLNRTDWPPDLIETF